MKYSILPIILVFMFYVYIGEDNGNMITGMQGELNKDEFFINADVRTYIPSIASPFFSPNKVVYSLEAGNNWLRIGHECFHPVISEQRQLPEYRSDNTYLKVVL